GIFWNLIVVEVRQSVIAPGEKAIEFSGFWLRLAGRRHLTVMKEAHHFFEPFRVGFDLLLRFDGFEVHTTLGLLGAVAFGAVVLKQGPNFGSEIRSRQEACAG